MKETLDNRLSEYSLLRRQFKNLERGAHSIEDWTKLQRQLNEMAIVACRIATLLERKENAQ